MYNYIAALLSDLSYLNVTAKTNESDISNNFTLDGKLTDVGRIKSGISAEEMTFFNDHFRVKQNSQLVGASGFSGLVFEVTSDIPFNGSTISTNDIYFGFRGTEPNIDLATDFELAIDSAVSLISKIKEYTIDLIAGNDSKYSMILDELFNYLKSTVFELTSINRTDAQAFFNISANQLIDQETGLYTKKIHLIGHSLGGYLANYVAGTNNNYTKIIDTTTFNPPGFNTTELVSYNLILSLKKIIDNTTDAIKIAEIQEKINQLETFISPITISPNAIEIMKSFYSTTGLEFTSWDGFTFYHPENRIPVYTDDAGGFGGIGNHSIKPLREAMALYDSLMCFIDESLTMSDKYLYVSKIVESYNKNSLNGINTVQQDSILAAITDISIFLGFANVFTSGIELLSYIGSLTVSAINGFHFKELNEVDLNSFNGSEASATMYALLHFTPFIIYGSKNLINEELYQSHLYNKESYSISNIQDRYNLYNIIMNVKNTTLGYGKVNSIAGSESYKVIYDTYSLTEPFVYIDELNKIAITNDPDVYDTIIKNELFNLQNDKLITTYFKSSSLSLDVNTLNNIIHDHFGDDYIALNKGASILDLSYGNDTIMIDVANGATIKELTIKDGGIGDLFIFNAGNTGSNITGTQYTDKLIGGAGNDTLIGGAGSDTLIGGDGNDQLNDLSSTKDYSSIGGDILYGGKGFNTLFGTGYGDNYFYLKGDGISFIYEKDFNIGNNYIDKLNFGMDISPTQISFSRNKFELVISIRDMSSIHVVGYFYHYEYLEEIHFADNTTVWYTNDIISRVKIEPDTQYGTYLNDIINGTSKNEYLYGADGDDTINAGEGDDIVYGGNGNDTLNGDAGNDFIYGEGGDDIINGGIGVDTLYGGNGNDTLNSDAGDDIVYGEDGNDVINGGIGVDTLYGGNGNDIIVGGSTVTNERDIISGGEGNDIINKGQLYTGDDIWGGLGNDEIYSNKGTDRYGYSLGDGHDIIYATTPTFLLPVNQIHLHNITASDISIYRRGINFNDLFIDINNGKGSITISDYYNNSSNTTKISHIIFNNGTTISRSQLLEMAKYYYGSDSNDTININNPLVNIIDSKSGNDIINIENTKAGSIINAGIGRDSINTSGQAITIHGDSDDDIIRLNYNGITGSGLIYGDDGNDIITFSYDRSSSNYTINGGKGDDKIYMSSGVETITYSLGDGKDTIYVSGNNLDSQVDKLIFNNIDKSTIDISSVLLSGKGSQVILKFNNNDQVTLANFLSSISSLNNLKTFEFNNGSLNNLEIKDLATKIVNAEDDGIFYDTFLDDTIIGTDNNDHIVSRYGNDTIKSGNGIDTIYSLHTSYELNMMIDSGNGDDIIKASDTNMTGNVLIDTGNGNDTIFSSGFNHNINSGDGDDKIYLNSHESQYGYGSGYINAGDGDDDISFSILSFKTSNYIIEGGKGNDKIRLSIFDDILVYKLGDGKDTIDTFYAHATYSIEQQDKIIFKNISKNSLNSNSLSLQNSGKDLLFTINENDQILFKNYLLTKSILNNLKFFEFDDGTLTNMDIKNLFTQIQDTNNNDIIYDTVWEDIIKLSDGNDNVILNSGNDTLYTGIYKTKVNINSSNNILYSGSGNDNFFFDSSYQQLYKNIIILTEFNNGTDTLYSNRPLEKVDVKLSIDSINFKISNMTVGGYLTISWNNNSSISVIKSDFNNYNFILNDRTINDVTELYSHFLGDEKNNTLTAFAGYDTYISGNDGDDTITGNNGNDSLYGDNGNDSIDGGSGNDLIDGGNGNDIIRGSSGDDKIYGGKGMDIIFSGYDSNFIDGGDDDDKIYTSSSQNSTDTVYGGNGNDWIIQQTISKVFLYGGNGDDKYEARENAVIVDHEGNNTLTLLKQTNERNFFKTERGIDIVYNDSQIIHYEGLLSKIEKTDVVAASGGYSSRYSLTGNEINQIFELMAQYDSTDDSNTRSNINTQINNLWKYEN